MSRPLRAIIDTGALRHNLAVARRHAGAARIWAVVKADAYGHGLKRAVAALSSHADGFALIELERAVGLREAGVRDPILMLEGGYEAADWPLMARYGLAAVVHHPEQLQQLLGASLPAPLDIYLKLNTGMNRLGFHEREFPAVLTALRQSAAVASITLMSHFADADEARGIGEQMGRFNAMAAGTGLPFSIANSAALLRFPEARGAWVRPGIMLYGSSPFPAMKTAEALDLQPVMSLVSSLIAVRDLQAGDRIGYGGLFVAEGPLRVGVVACGYGDGYPRHAPTGTPVVVGGRRTRTLGRVSMDKICVDLTPVPDAAVGAPVLLWGRHDGARLDADEIATAAGTVAYELFCALAPRVPVVERDS